MHHRDGVPIWVKGNARPLEREPARDEAWLQELLFNHPECLPMADIEPGFDDLISICRELPTAHGPIDNLFMTKSGDIVIVETKLWRNPQARREVVAQALDYASCLFEMSYEDFESAVLRANHAPRERPKSLYGVFARPDAISESAFVDAVSFNLQRGRIVMLVVGDGIRSETERLASALQSHAGFHFTFALVELGVFRLPDNEALLVVPRTLGKTVMIERGIVQIEKGVRIVPPKEALAADAQKSSITAEQFYDAMRALEPSLPDKLKLFISRLEKLGVYPDFQRSLILRWDPPTGKSINLGYIMRDGQVWTDGSNKSFPSLDLAHQYIGELAGAWHMKIDGDNFGDEIWTVRDKDGKAPRIYSVADRLNDWYSVIENSIRKLNSLES